MGTVEGTTSPTKEEEGRKESPKPQSLLGPIKEDAKAKKRLESPGAAKADRPVSGCEGVKEFVPLDSLSGELVDQLVDRAEMLPRYQAVKQNAKHYISVVSGRHVTGETKQVVVLFVDILSHSLCGVLFVVMFVVAVCWCKRCCLWGDLARVARKNYVWDVAQVAATFCLQFDGDVKTESSGE